MIDFGESPRKLWTRIGNPPTLQGGQGWTSEGRILFPFDAVRVNFVLKVA